MLQNTKVLGIQHHMCISDFEFLEIFNLYFNVHSIVVQTRQPRGPYLKNEHVLYVYSGLLLSSGKNL